MATVKVLLQMITGARHDLALAPKSQVVFLHLCFFCSTPLALLHAKTRL
jgi:hypothetical protein